jgi:PAS domain S-box-containing protein
MPPQHSNIAPDELLRLAIDASTGYAIFAMNDTGEVISWNVGAERLLGFKEADILGKSADVIFTPEDRLAGVPEGEREMAMTQGRAEDERWHMRRDGSRFWASGLMQPLPERIGFMKIMRDQTDRHLAEKRMRASEDRFRTLATNIPQLVFASLPTGSRTWGSPQWIVFTGLDEPRSLDFGWLNAVHPEDREATVSGWQRARQSGIYDIEHRILRAKTGEYRWHQTRATPLNPDALDSSEWVGTSTDIHELKGLKESQDVLLAELQHRTRNLIAMIQAIARRSARSGHSLAAFVADFEQRLRALSRAESLMPASGHVTIPIRRLVDTELAAHVDEASAERVSIQGGSIGVSPGAAQLIALALHELATNAVKYGALRESNGRLRIEWSGTDEPGGKMVHLIWRESGVSMPTEEERRRRGYGTELIERALPYQLGAETRLQYLPDGVRCEVRIPVVSNNG